MPGLSLDDEGKVSRLVGFPTWRRGRRYAAEGAVLEQEWSPDGADGEGLVDGSGPEPYRVAVHLERDVDGSLLQLTSDCTCPMGQRGQPCKHAVALLVASGVEHTPQRRAVGAPSTAQIAPVVPLRPVREPVAEPPGALRPEWERRLAGLIGPAASPAPPAGRPALAPGATLGLQFELAERPPAGYSRVPAHRRGAGRPGVRVRPVTRSGAGNWVRSGISWAQLDSLGYGGTLSGRTAEQIAVLRELKMLSRLDAAHRFTGYGDDVLWLESVPSRRLWDVLAQVRELGIPLLRAGRDATGVRLEEPLTAAADVVANDAGGLEVRPELRASDGSALTPAGVVFVGAPAHGVVWFDAAPVGDETPPLRLAPLRRSIDAATGAFLLGGAVTVGVADAERFTRAALPALARRVEVRSSDGSTPTPDISDDTVVVAVHWTRRRDGAAEAEVTWQLPDDPSDATVAAAAAVAAGEPALVEVSEWGTRPRARVTLGGMHAVVLATEVLPKLAGLAGVGVAQSGSLPEFREASGPVDVRLTGAESAGGDWLDLSVEVRIGGELVPYRDVFLALAEGRDAVVLPSGTWGRLDSPELRRLAELIGEARALHDAPPGQARLSRYQASLWDELSELADIDVRAEQWRTSVEALAGAADAPPAPLPVGLQATLRPYQVDGFRWLATRYDLRLGGILADEMGLGKTLMALTLVLHARAQGATPWLVVCPTSVMGTWAGEAAKFAPDLRVAVVTETSAKRGTSLASVVAGADVVVTSYTLFRLDHTEHAGVAWAGMLLDEAQAVKNPSSHASRHARRLPVPFKLAMTGTPLENTLRELWAITAITSPGLFGSSERFDAAFRRPVERDRDPEALAALRRRLHPVLLRRKKSEVAAELPDKQEQVLTLELEPRHRAVYDTLLARERQRVLGLLGDLDGNRFEVLRSLTTLRQAALDVTLVDPSRSGVPSTKLDALVELLTETAAEGHRSLVFSQFTRFLSLARERLEAAGIACAYLDGSTRDRPAVIERWRSGDAPAFLISLKAGGVGLTLTEADHCVLLDPWWNPAAEAQAVDRAHRIGQTRKVLVQRMVAAGTIEEKVMALKARKAALFDDVVDGGGFESTALSADDVRALLG